MKISIDFNKICTEFGTPKGIIHIGAHVGEESDQYENNGVKDVIWIEANPKVFNKLKGNVPTHNICINKLLYDKNKMVKFNLTNNVESSSVLKMKKHLKVYAKIKVTKSIKLMAITFRKLVRTHKIDLQKYDFLNLDVQGAELKVLLGMGQLINYFKMAYVEINLVKMYRGCPLLQDVDEYFKKFKFKRIKLTNIYNESWGEALYIKDDSYAPIHLF